MKSGLEGRNNHRGHHQVGGLPIVSMKSGLEGRNNEFVELFLVFDGEGVSMKSGLEGRNNPLVTVVRRQPVVGVSMKSGLEGRNNPARPGYPCNAACPRLNEVRPRRPEQSKGRRKRPIRAPCLNEVRPRRPEQFWLHDGHSYFLLESQ